MPEIDLTAFDMVEQTKEGVKKIQKRQKDPHWYETEEEFLGYHAVSVWSDLFERVTGKRPYQVGLKSDDIKDFPIDPRWIKFINFDRDMGSPPSRHYDVERIDPQKSYCKANCRWVSTKVDYKTHLFDYRGDRLTLSQISDLEGIPYRRLLTRVATMGLTPECAVRKDIVNKPITYGGETMMLYEWATKLNIHYGKLVNAIVTKGMSVEEAFRLPPKVEKKIPVKKIRKKKKQ